MRTLIAIGLGMSCMLLAADETAQKIRVTKTERIDFPSGGALKLTNPVGELTVQGWDRPDVEIATLISTKEAYDARDREKAARELDEVHVTAERRGNDVVVTTDSLRRRVTKFYVSYDIKIPRNAKLTVDHGLGEVHVADVTGDVQVTDRRGLITLRLAETGQYAIDAKSDIGGVTSDFPGAVKRKPWPVGHQFVQNTSGAAQKLYLRIGYGDILILQEHRPPTPAALVP